MPAPYRSQDTPSSPHWSRASTPSPSLSLPTLGLSHWDFLAPLPNVLPLSLFINKNILLKLSSDCTSPGSLLWVPRQLSGRHSVQRVPPGLCRLGYNYDL